MKAKMALLIVVLTLSGCVRGASDELLHVYLIRHAEAFSNVRGNNMQAEEGDQLTPKGFEQAAALGEFLKDKRIAAVVCSPTNRTQQTAAEICKKIGLSKGYIVDAAFFSVTGGETLGEGQVRSTAAMMRLAKEYSGKAVVVISHSEICAPLLGRAKNTPIDKCYELHYMPNGTYSELFIIGEEWQLLSQGVYPER